MERKFSRDNIVRAVDFIAKYCDRTISRADSRIRRARELVQKRQDLLVEMQKLIESAGHVLDAGNCSAQPPKLGVPVKEPLAYRMLKKETNRYAEKQARRIKFYELVKELVHNYYECRAHIMCATAENPEKLPSYKKELEDNGKWVVLPSAPSRLAQAFLQDSNGKALNDFFDYACRLKNRANPMVQQKLMKMDRSTQIKVQMMVYTGKFARMYPIVIMLPLYLDSFGHVRIDGGHSYSLPLHIPENWIPIMCRIPREPRKITIETTQGEDK